MADTEPVAASPSVSSIPLDTVLSKSENAHFISTAQYSRQDCLPLRTCRVSNTHAHHTVLTHTRASSAHSHDSRNSTSRRDSTRSDRDSDRRRRRDSPGRIDDHRDHRSSGRRDDRDRDHRRDDRDRDDNRDNKRRRSRSRDRDNRSRRDDDRYFPFPHITRTHLLTLRLQISPSQLASSRQQISRSPSSSLTLSTRVSSHFHSSSYFLMLRKSRQTEEEREMRSVFVSQLAGRVTDRELGIFFDVQAGKVREAKVITDRISRRSKGFV